MKIVETLVPKVKLSLKIQKKILIITLLCYVITLELKNVIYIGLHDN